MINKKDFCSYIDNLVDMDKDIVSKSEKVNDCTGSDLGTLIFFELNESPYYWLVVKILQEQMNDTYRYISWWLEIKRDYPDIDEFSEHAVVRFNGSTLYLNSSQALYDFLVNEFDKEKND